MRRDQATLGNAVVVVVITPLAGASGTLVSLVSLAFRVGRVGRVGRVLRIAIELPSTDRVAADERRTEVSDNFMQCVIAPGSRPASCPQPGFRNTQNHL